MKKNTFFAKQNHVVKGLVVLIMVWLVWFVGSALVGQVRDLFVQSQEVRYATMEHMEDGYGMFTATEHLIIAQADGDMEVLIAEGERVRKGNAVFRVGDLYQYTNYAGRVSYRIDGLESVKDIGAVSALNMKQKYNEQKKMKGTVRAAEGEPCAKVQETMSDIALYLALPINDYTSTLTTGQKLTVNLSDNGTSVKGTVAEILNTEEIRCVKLDIGSISAETFQQRIYQITLPYNSERVLVIPKSALIQKRGVQGVYCLHKGFVFWKEITVSDRWLEHDVYVAESGLEAGDIVVTTPRLVKEGENIKF